VTLGFATGVAASTCQTTIGTENGITLKGECSLHYAAMVSVVVSVVVVQNTAMHLGA
jgi:hypothetical protein